MNNTTRNNIKARIRSKMDTILERRINSLKEDMDNIRISNPFGSRLVPNEIWKGSKFERSFVTTFGQGVYEQVALEIARGSGAYAENQYAEKVTLNSWQEEGISNLLAEQRTGASKGAPEWNQEVNHLTTLNTPRTTTVNTIFDLYVKRENGREEYYSLKTVKPNLDQTEIAKRDMLYMSVAKPSSCTFFSLPFNPYGEGNQYKWSMPYKLFDMNNSPAVLIGANFWNTVGNDPNTYDELLVIFDELGHEYLAKIKTDYLY